MACNNTKEGVDGCISVRAGLWSQRGCKEGPWKHRVTCFNNEVEVHRGVCGRLPADVSEEGGGMEA